MVQNGYLLAFATSFVGCILATPVVTRMAGWVGAIDRPDQFRRIHKGAVPRLGGLAVAFGLLLTAVGAMSGLGGQWPAAAQFWNEQWATLVAGGIVLLLGVLDDTRGVNPRPKLLGQTAAVLVLAVGGVRITNFSLLGMPFSVSYPIPITVLGFAGVIDPPSVVITVLWFLACINIWNLIDGMDGLASGVGLLVSGTLMLVALRTGNNAASALLSAALAGSLAGFLLYNWHPACIFLGDSGSMLIGLLIGVVGVQSSMKGTTTVSILFPILAMGLPITDTAMAIFRRWVRELPLSAADRRHVHHLLIGLGLNPRQAAVMLYCFSGFLCGVVLLGVTLHNSVHGEFFALVVGGSGCLAFLLILTSRRDELEKLARDLQTRHQRKRQEKAATTLTWESIQKIELCEGVDSIWEVMERAARVLGCGGLSLCCMRGGRTLLERELGERRGEELSGSSVRFRMGYGEDVRLVVALEHAEGESKLASDIAFRCMQRLSLAVVQRVERLEEEAAMVEVVRPVVEVESGESVELVTKSARADGPGRYEPVWHRVGWIRRVLGLKPVIQGMGWRGEP